MSSVFNRFAEFPQNQVTITPSDTDDIPRGVVLIECGSDGDIVTQDQHGNQVTRTVLAGYIIPVLITRVLSTGTTVNPVIGLY